MIKFYFFSFVILTVGLHAIFLFFNVSKLQYATWEEHENVSWPIQSTYEVDEYENEYKNDKIEETEKRKFLEWFSNGTTIDIDAKFSYNLSSCDHDFKKKIDCQKFNIDNKKIDLSISDVLLLHKQSSLIANKYSKQLKNMKTYDYSELSISEEDERKWIQILCPEVIDHFKQAPYFDYTPYDRLFGSGIHPTVMTTEAAIKQTCLLKVVDIVARKLNLPWMLYAGGALGAILHGGPIPWDDDVDILVDIQYKDEFEKELKNFRIPEVPTFNIELTQTNCLKLSTKGSIVTESKKGLGHLWPFIDVFYFRKNKNVLEEINYNRFVKRTSPEYFIVKNKWNINDYFPLKNIFYGGLILPAPASIEATRLRYNFKKCFVPKWNHRLELPAYKPYKKTEILCDTMKPYFPFKYYQNLTYNNKTYHLQPLVIGNKLIHLEIIDTSNGKKFFSKYQGTNESRYFMENSSKGNSSFILHLTEEDTDPFNKRYKQINTPNSKQLTVNSNSKQLTVNSILNSIERISTQIKEYGTNKCSSNHKLLLNNRERIKEYEAKSNYSNDTINILFCISDDDLGTFEELTVLLRSIFLNLPKSQKPLHFYFMLDDKAHKQIEYLLAKYQLKSTQWPVHITFTLINMSKVLDNLKELCEKKIYETLGFGFGNINKLVHKFGTMYRLFSDLVLPEDFSGEILYLDIDVIILKDIEEFWKVRDKTKLMQFGYTSEDDWKRKHDIRACAGMMFINIGLFKHIGISILDMVSNVLTEQIQSGLKFLNLPISEFSNNARRVDGFSKFLKECRKEIDRISGGYHYIESLNEKSTINDQHILYLLRASDPDLFGFLPLAYQFSFFDVRISTEKKRHHLLEEFPGLGALHMNGGGGKSRYWEYYANDTSTISKLIRYYTDYDENVILESIVLQNLILETTHS